MSSALITCFILILLASPYFLIFFNVSSFSIKDVDEVMWAMKNTLIQSVGSGALAILFGLFAALGLLAFQRSSRIRTLLEISILIPGFLPPLFFILILLDSWRTFPTGVFGISIAHSMVSFGLVAVILARNIESHLVRYSEVALTLGSSPGRFLFSILLPLMKKDLWFLFLFVFSMSYASFSIPLILGGGQGITMEVLIYERLRHDSDWGSALGLGVIQAIGIFILGLFYRHSENRTTQSPYPMRLVGSYPVSFVIFLSLSFLIFRYVQFIWGSLGQWREVIQILVESIDAIFATLVISISSGCILYILLMLVIAVLPYRPLEGFLRGYLAPSTAVACFGFLGFGQSEVGLIYIKMIVVICILNMGTLFRLGVYPRFSRLQDQITTAKILGANQFLIFSKIIFPQMNSSLILYSGIAAVWAAGDFGVAKILGNQEMTFSLILHSLLSTYRLELASLLSVFLLMICLAVFFLFYGVSRVCDQKFES